MNFVLWLLARVGFVLGVTFSLCVCTMVGVAKYDTSLGSQLLWLALISVLCYGTGAACWLTRTLRS